MSNQQSQQECDQQREDKFEKNSKPKKSAEITVFNSNGIYVPNPVMKLLKKVNITAEEVNQETMISLLH